MLHPFPTDPPYKTKKAKGATAYSTPKHANDVSVSQLGESSVTDWRWNGVHYKNEKNIYIKSLIISLSLDILPTFVHAFSFKTEHH